MVNGVVPRQDQLGDRHEGVPLPDQVFQNAGQRFGRVLGGVVEQHDRPRLDLGGHPLGDVRGGEVLPIQGVNVRRGFKPLYLSIVPLAVC